MWVESYGVMPHVYIVTVGPTSNGTISPRAVSKSRIGSRSRGSGDVTSRPSRRRFFGCAFGGRAVAVPAGGGALGRLAGRCLGLGHPVAGDAGQLQRHAGLV